MVSVRVLMIPYFGVYHSLSMSLIFLGYELHYSEGEVMQEHEIIMNIICVKCKLHFLPVENILT